MNIFYIHLYLHCTHTFTLYYVIPYNLEINFMLLVEETMQGYSQIF